MSQNQDWNNFFQSNQQHQTAFFPDYNHNNNNSSVFSLDVNPESNSYGFNLFNQQKQTKYEYKNQSIMQNNSYHFSQITIDIPEQNFIANANDMNQKNQKFNKMQQQQKLHDQKKSTLQNRSELFIKNPIINQNIVKQKNKLNILNELRKSTIQKDKDKDKEDKTIYQVSQIQTILNKGQKKNNQIQQKNPNSKVQPKQNTNFLLKYLQKSKVKNNGQNNKLNQANNKVGRLYCSSVQQSSQSQNQYAPQQIKKKIGIDIKSKYNFKINKQIINHQYQNTQNKSVSVIQINKNQKKNLKKQIALNITPIQQKSMQLIQNLNKQHNKVVFPLKNYPIQQPHKNPIIQNVPNKSIFFPFDKKFTLLKKNVQIKQQKDRRKSDHNRALFSRHVNYDKFEVSMTKIQQQINKLTQQCQKLDQKMNNKSDQLQMAIQQFEWLRNKIQNM